MAEPFRRKAIFVKLSAPREQGGQGGDATPPELFAAGYSACVIGTLKFVTSQQKQALPANTAVTAIVGIGQIPGGFGLEVELQLSLPSLDRELAQSLIDAARQVCPYQSNPREHRRPPGSELIASDVCPFGRVVDCELTPANIKWPYIDRYQLNAGPFRTSRGKGPVRPALMTDESENDPAHRPLSASTAEKEHCHD